MLGIIAILFVAFAVYVLISGALNFLRNFFGSTFRPVLQPSFLRKIATGVFILAAIVLDHVVRFIRSAATSVAQVYRETTSDSAAVQGTADTRVSPLLEFIAVAQRSVVVMGGAIASFSRSMWESVSAELNSWEAAQRAAAAARDEAGAPISPAFSTPAPYPSGSGATRVRGRHITNMDVYEDAAGDKIVAVLEVPGVKREEVDITLVDDRLDISFERKAAGMLGGAASLSSATDVAGAGPRYRLRERAFGKITRTIDEVPVGTKVDDVKATMEDGILIIEFPSKPTQILPVSRKVKVE